MPECHVFALPDDLARVTRVSNRTDRVGVAHLAAAARNYSKATVCNCEPTCCNASQQISVSGPGAPNPGMEADAASARSRCSDGLLITSADYHRGGPSPPLSVGRKDVAVCIHR